MRAGLADYALGAPHAPQKRAPAASAAEHFVQAAGTIKALPHSPQKRDSALLTRPHPEQARPAAACGAWPPADGPQSW
jgi:hypothetical protein